MSQRQKNYYVGQFVGEASNECHKVIIKAVQAISHSRYNISCAGRVYKNYRTCAHDRREGPMVIQADKKFYTALLCILIIAMRRSCNIQCRIICATEV